MDTFVKYFFRKLPKLYPLHNSLDTAWLFLKKNLSKWICTNLLDVFVYLLEKKGFSVITVFVSRVYQNCSILRWSFYMILVFRGWNFTRSSWENLIPRLHGQIKFCPGKAGQFSTWHLFRFVCSFFEFFFVILSVYEIKNPYTFPLIYNFLFELFRFLFIKLEVVVRKYSSKWCSLKFGNIRRKA